MQFQFSVTVKVRINLLGLRVLIWRNKHIDITYLFVRNVGLHGEVHLVYESNSEMVSDTLANR